VPADVVDLLEAVEVDHEQAEGLRGPSRPLQRLLHSIVEEDAVGEAGERVGEGEEARPAELVYEQAYPERARQAEEPADRERRLAVAAARELSGGGGRAGDEDRRGEGPAKLVPGWGAILGCGHGRCRCRGTGRSSRQPVVARYGRSPQVSAPRTGEAPPSSEGLLRATWARECSTLSGEGRGNR